jgi:nucleoside-diphosphate-sugar epimerase
MKVFVTGAGGYIGTTLVPMLLDKGCDVIALDRFFFGEDYLKDHPRLTKIKADSREYDFGLMKDVDAVIDLVAISNDPSGDLLPRETDEINFRSRATTAMKAKEYGVKRYILPSSCSIYGFQDAIVNEESAVNPITLYAKANLSAENAVKKLADDNFTVVILRQSTLYGYSPRMRFDLAINGMTFGAWKTGKLPLMRDGSQWRPMVHVKDTSRAMIFMLNAEQEKTNGNIFNVGSVTNSNYQIKTLGEMVANTIPNDVKIEWYGDPDHRSYQVSFDKLAALGFKCEQTIENGIEEMAKALENGLTDKTDKTITLKWYQNLIEWNETVNQVAINRRIL